MNINNGFINHLNIQFKETLQGEIEAHVKIEEYHHNIYEYVHGGVYFTLADSLAGYLVRTSGNNYVTLNSSFNFFKAEKEGHLIGRGVVVSTTNRIATVNVNVYNGSEEVVSMGTFTMYRLSNK